MAFEAATRENRVFRADIEMQTKSNIVLIGMPGVGKSTVGVLLAKALSRSFVDTDLVVQSAEGRRLQDIIDAEGLAVFLEAEERHVLALECRNAVISTGGSVPYSKRAMAKLRQNGTVVYLKLDLATLQRRITNMDSRGIAIGPEQTFDALYAERTPLYERYADVVIDCAGLDHEQTVAAVLAALGA